MSLNEGLRPLLAAQYIEKYHTAPPVLFSDLLKLDMPKDLKNAINELIEIKKNTTEKEENPHIPAIIEFIQSVIIKQKEISTNMPDDNNKDWGALNSIFSEIIE